MLDLLLKRLSSAEPAAAAEDDLHLAVAVLLIEAARMDDAFDPAERAVIARLLTEKFNLSATDTETLLARAEVISKRSSQIHPFTRTAVARMDQDQRIRLIEMLWEVAYADGVLDPEEDALLRRVAGLIYVTDSERGAARRRVLTRLGLN